MAEKVQEKDDSIQLLSEAEEFKEKGNAAFRSGDFETALNLFNKAIELDNSNSKYYVNRSLCFASLLNWSNSAKDAKQAIYLSPKSVKAHYRMVKALFELKRWKDARLALLHMLKECGEVKEAKGLEDELFKYTNIPLRPKSTDFEILSELGDGNFSKVYKAEYRPTGEVFAVKV